MEGGFSGNGLLSVLGHGGGLRNGKVNGDVTPRAFLNGRCHLANRADMGGVPPPVIEATSSVATIRGLESSGPHAVHASTHRGANANVKPRANRELVPFEADSELWPYPSTQAVAGGQQQAAHQEGGQSRFGEQHDSGDEDADIVELDFEDTSVLSDLDAFKRAAREQRGLASRRDARKSSELREEQRDSSSYRAVAASSLGSRSGLGESSPREKGKGKKKTRKERDARERDAIEKSWDVPDFCAGYVPLQEREQGVVVVQQDRQGQGVGQQQQQPQQVKTTTRYLTQAVTSPPASPSPPLSPSLSDNTPQMPVYTPQISVHTPPRSVHTPQMRVHALQMPVHTPPRSVHTPQMRVHTPPRSVHTPLGSTYPPSPGIPSSDVMTPTMSGKTNGAGGKGRKLASMNGSAAKVNGNGNGHVERNGHVGGAVEGNGHVDVSLVRGSIVAAMNAQPRVAAGMERNEFVREVLTLIHVRFLFRFFFL